MIFMDVLTWRRCPVDFSTLSILFQLVCCITVLQASTSNNSVVWFFAFSRNASDHNSPVCVTYSCHYSLLTLCIAAQQRSAYLPTIGMCLQSFIGLDQAGSALFARWEGLDQSGPALAPTPLARWDGLDQAGLALAPAPWPGGRG